MAEVRDRLRAAALLMEGALPAAAVSDAYYAMLYAARAALSEVDRYAKTHSGTWDQFHLAFAANGRFDQTLAGDARATQRFREGADYEALLVKPKEAARIADLAQRFVAAVEEMFKPGP